VYQLEDPSMKPENQMTTYVISKNILEGGWVSKAFPDTTQGIVALTQSCPDRIVVDLESVDEGSIRAIRRSFSGPLVVVGKGTQAAEAIKGGADDYAETFEDVPDILKDASRRHSNRECAVNLSKKMASAFIALPLIGGTI
jgi:ActR/RegA family two-component response regulator